jgi:hypothetical protein
MFSNTSLDFVASPVSCSNSINSDTWAGSSILYPWTVEPLQSPVFDPIVFTPQVYTSFGLPGIPDGDIVVLPKDPVEKLKVVEKILKDNEVLIEKVAKQIRKSNGQTEEQPCKKQRGRLIRRPAKKCEKE